MTKDTIAFIESLFEFYQQSSSGKEPENAEALNKAWDEIERIKAVRVIESNPEDITPCKVDAITMPNGEVLSCGKVLGRIKDFSGAITTKA